MAGSVVPLAFTRTWYDAILTAVSGKGGRPMVTEGVFTPAHVLAGAIQRREVSSLEVVEAYLTQIARHNPDLNAVVTLEEDGARVKAQEADAALARGEEWGPLHGLPITLEDGHSTSGMRTTWGGLPRMADCVPEEDGTVAARLKAAGAILLGKTNGPEIWPDSIFARTSNPWNLARREARAPVSAPRSPRALRHSMSAWTRWARSRIRPTTAASTGCVLRSTAFP